MTSKDPNQTIAGTQPAPAKAESGSKTDTPLPQLASTTASRSVATIECSSNPAGADIEVDGEFMGNTPSSLSLEPGEHTIKISKAGYKPWERKMKVTAGNIKISGDLEQDAPPQAK